MVQRTLSGTGFIEEGGVLQAVRQSEAMLFRHGDNSRYGYPKDGNEAYALEFIVMYGGSCIQIYETIKARTGAVISIPEGSEADRLFSECLLRCQKRSFHDIYHETTLAYALLIALARQAEAQPWQRDPLSFAEEYMNAHYQQPIAVEDVARVAGLSREHFSRSYKLRYGQSPGQALLSKRMENARRMLTSSFARVEHVAQHCGYRDSDAFIRAFRRCFGKTPLKYRKSEIA